MGYMKNLYITIYGGGQDAVEAAMKLSTAGEWIAVTERLPPDRTVVLAWSGKRVAFGYVSDGDWIDTLYGWFIPNGPTHWMPLPEPPDHVG